MKQLITCTLLCFTLHATADSAFTGFYVAGGIGGTAATYDMNQYMEAIVPGATTISRPLSEEVVGNNVAGMLGVGYAYKLQQGWVLGAEITAALTHAKGHLDNDFYLTQPIIINATSGVDTTLRNDFAILFKPGMLITEKAQLYVLVGPRWGNIETTLFDALEFSSVDSGALTEGKDTTSGYFLGVTGGVGIETMLIKNLSMALEYAYTSYDNIHTAHVQKTIPSTPDAGTLIDSTSIRAETSSIMLNFAYWF